MLLSVRERILTIRLMEKVYANPIYAEAFGIIAEYNLAESELLTTSSSAENKS